MAGLRFRSGLPEQIASLTDHLVVAIDLGFSKASKSCGVAWRDGSGQPLSEGLRFGDCVTRVAALLKGHPAAVLIIEAPLSGLFSSTGDPVERGEFERKDPSGACGTPRYWYSGPGAATCLAAVFFLRKLIAAMKQFPKAERPSEIVLYEGFVTFKLEGTEHVSDAQRLLNCFLGTHPRSVNKVKADGGQAVIAITDVVQGSAEGTVAPAIITPSKHTAEDETRGNQGSARHG